MNNKLAKQILGVIGLVGAAAAAWYFLEPTNGPRRRKKFVKRTRKAYTTAEREVRRLSKEAAEGISGSYNKASEYAKSGIHSLNNQMHRMKEKVSR